MISLELVLGANILIYFSIFYPTFLNRLKFYLKKYPYITKILMCVCVYIHIYIYIYI